MLEKDNPISEFRFIGTGTQYFGIWIVNLLLSILTLGIYSAWAKVRRQQFFYQHTLLNEHRFDYTGDPIRILIGRIVAVAILAFQSVTQSFTVDLASAIGIIIFLIFPWLIKQTYVFTARNSRYRNIRFHFTGNLLGAYIVYILWPLLAVITLGLLTPFAHYAHKQYFFECMRYGKHKVKLSLKAGQIYGVYFKSGLLFIGLFMAAALLLYMLNMGKSFNVLINKQAAKDMVGFAFVVPLLLFIPLVTYSFFNAQITNLVWSNISIANNQFKSTITTMGLLWISVSNWVLLVLTVGLFHPWAKVRMTKYRLENMSVTWAANPDELMGSNQQDSSAMGEEVADFLGFDLSL